MRGINFFGFFLDSLNFFFRRRSSFTSAVQISYRYRSSFSLSFFFPLSKGNIARARIVRPYPPPPSRSLPRRGGIPACPPLTHAHSFLDFCNSELRSLSRKSQIVLCKLYGYRYYRRIRISNFVIACGWIRLADQMRRAQFCSQPATHHSAAM